MMGVGYSLPEKPDHHLFDNQWLSKLNTDGEYVTLYHFGLPNLEVLDPKHFGKHNYTSSELWWGMERIFFYTDLKDKERIVGGQLYEVDVKLSDLYPFNKDPLNLYDIAVKKYGNDDVPVRRQVIFISNLLKDMGYKGMIYKWKGELLLAVIWDKVRNLRSSDVKNVEYELPISDNVGWPIKNGLSTNPKLSHQEKIDVVVKLMRERNYPEEFINNYLKNIHHI